MRDKTRCTAYLTALFVGIISSACEQPQSEERFDFSGAVWQQHDPGTSASFRGLSVVSHDIIWASGSNGTVVRSLDGGQTWRSDTVPGAIYLDFRDIQAFDAGTVYIMSAGAGDASRIYKTTDGGKNWSLQYSVADSAGFLDGMAFWDENQGIAYSDPVDGHFLVIRTLDGQTWQPVPTEQMPSALSGEHGFAASGTGIATVDKNHVWFGTGGAAARVFHSSDQGETWTVAETPINSGEPSAGIFSLAFVDSRRGIAVGGDYQKPELSAGNAAVTDDGGRTWSMIENNQPAGFRSSVVYLSGSQENSLLTIGTSGSDYSMDGGLSWTLIDTVGSNALDGALRGNAFWTVGARGFFARLLPAGAASAY